MFTLIALGTGVAYFTAWWRPFLPDFPGFVPRRWPAARRLLRTCRGDHHAGAARPGPGTARAQPDRRRHSRAAGTRAEDRARPNARRTKRHPARPSEARRSSARAAWREDAG